MVGVYTPVLRHTEFIAFSHNFRGSVTQNTELYHFLPSLPVALMITLLQNSIRDSSSHKKLKKPQITVHQAPY
jgi:hypothetical protein